MDVKNRIVKYLKNLTDDEFRYIIYRSSDFIYLSDGDHNTITKETLVNEIIEEYPDDCNKIFAIIFLVLDIDIDLDTETKSKPKPAVRFSILDKMTENIKITDLIRHYFRYIEQDIPLSPLFRRLDLYRKRAITEYSKELEMATEYFNKYGHLMFYNLPIKHNRFFCRNSIGFLAALSSTIGHVKAFHKFVESVSIDDRRNFKKELLSK
ncbi:putative tlr signaling inhibitor [Raccoonpox virus]|uniref:Putative TLR signaling inhibitor n=1 Tax=Raccoon poxvirus TaxID=10256 RepID=A0A0G3G2F1_RACVI|nr:putative TLR signaling inhibitor [Raccoonpox virus]AKJ93657.1 putative TLR signaling inhibitor [Raccoonpox virus]AOP31288.1 putative tlr signaling inhibitor [Raccoonpox virus]